MNLPPGVAEADAAVVLEGVSEHLLGYIAQLGLIHQALYGEPLVITSGKDRDHGMNSLHYEGRAVDLRTKDKTEAEMVVWMAVVAWSAPRFRVTVFDKRGLGLEEHLHLEDHAPA